MRFIRGFVIAASYVLIFLSSAQAQSVTIGETAVLSSGDSGNGNLLAAQSANLAQAATIQSLSFYVTAASGSLILGIYDATGRDGGPGALKASTKSFTPTTGWNTANVVTPVSLAVGSYWLAYLPSSNALSFVKTNASGNCAYYGYNFGSLPSEFSASPNSCTPATWSFYATLTPAQTFTIGETAVLSSGDSGNGNLLAAQSANLAQAATIQSLSFYVTAASGSLILGIYDATGRDGGPGALKASTKSFTPTTGWNTANVVTPVSLAVGSYWLAYLPSSNALSFVKTNASGNCAYYGYNFGSLPSEFSASPNSCTPATWSFYATMTLPAASAVNGACGSSNGADSTSKPTANLCSAGAASSVNGSGPWNWTCAGSGGGTTASCSSLYEINGACGSSNGASLASAPTSGLCSAGSASTVAGSGPWKWSCVGSSGGTTATCSAQASAQPVNGACGSSSGADRTSTPTANLCSAGAASSVSGSGPWTWTCAGSGGGTTASCSALLEINGTCGSANGVAVSTKPTANLCSAGTASTVAGSGPWSWSCAGSNGGATVVCTDSLASTGSSGSSDPTSGLLPSDRDASANWKMAGLQSVGGIPNRTTQCGATVKPSGGDDTSNIQTAVNNCTSGDFVLLSVGTFTIGEGNYVTINKSITVRGSGPCAGTGIGAIPYPSTSQSYCTLIQRTGGSVLYNQGGATPSSHFLMGGGDQYGNSFFGTTTNLAVNGAQGATTIQVASTTGFSVGQAVLIDEHSNMGWQPSWIPWASGSTKVWGASDYRMNWLAQDPTCSPADKFCSGGSTAPAIPCYFSWHGSDCSNYVNEIKQIASIGAGPCPGTACTITFDDPLMISYRTANSAHVAVLYGGTSGTTPAVTYAGIENMTLQNADEPTVWINLCNYCWLKNVEIDIMSSNISAGAVAFEAGFRDQLEEVYIHDGSHPYPGGAGYNISLDIGTSEALIENSISMRNDKMLVARMGGSGSVIANSYFDEAICGGCSGQTEDGVNSSHWLGPHHVLLEGNWTFQASNDPVWGPTIFDTWFRNDVSGYRTTFVDRADGYTINDYTGAPSLVCVGYHNCADGINMAFADYWQSFVGNVIGTSGKMSGWTYYSPGTNNVIWQAGEIGSGESAFDNEVWTQQSGTAAANCVTTSGDQCPLIRYYNYDYVTNSINDPSVGTSLPNSFVFTSAPPYFRTGSGYTWPWVTPTGSTKVQVGPTTSACTTNVGGPCSGLPAKARMDNGTPFVQP